MTKMDKNQKEILREYVQERLDIMNSFGRIEDERYFRAGIQFLRFAGIYVVIGGLDDVETARIIVDEL